MDWDKSNNKMTYNVRLMSHVQSSNYNIDLSVAKAYIITLIFF